MCHSFGCVKARRASEALPAPHLLLPSSFWRQSGGRRLKRLPACGQGVAQKLVVTAGEGLPPAALLLSLVRLGGDVLRDLPLDIRLAAGISETIQRPDTRAPHGQTGRKRQADETKRGAERTSAESAGATGSPALCNRTARRLRGGPGTACRGSSANACLAGNSCTESLLPNACTTKTASGALLRPPPLAGPGCQQAARTGAAYFWAAPFSFPPDADTPYGSMAATWPGVAAALRRGAGVKTPLGLGYAA